MKRKTGMSLVMAVIMVTMLVLAANAAAEPVSGGKTVFTVEDFKIDYDSVNGNGAFKAYRVDMSVVTVDGKEVVKFTAQNEAKQGLIDFSYYQYNNSEYLPALKTGEYPYLLIKYRREAPAQTEFAFWKATEDALGKGGTNASCTFKAESTAWETMVVNLSEQSSLKWNEASIRQFRLYPWGMKNANEFAGQTMYIEYFGFFKTEAEALAYGAASAPEAADTAESPRTFDGTAMALAVLAMSMCAAVCVKRRVK